MFKQKLNLMHRQKIDMSDEIFVINKDEYIGESTKAEIEYAKRNAKTVSYLESQLESLKPETSTKPTVSSKLTGVKINFFQKLFQLLFQFH